MDTPEFEAAHAIYDRFLKTDVDVVTFFMFWRDAHATTGDPGELAQRMRWGRAEILDHPATFHIDDGHGVEWVLPWPTVRKIVVRTLWQQQALAWSWIEAQEREASHAAIFGRYIGSGRGRLALSPKEAREDDDAYSDRRERSSKSGCCSRRPTNRYAAIDSPAIESPAADNGHAVCDGLRARRTPLTCPQVASRANCGRGGAIQLLTPLLRQSP